MRHILLAACLASNLALADNSKAVELAKLAYPMDVWKRTMSGMSQDTAAMLAAQGAPQTQEFQAALQAELERLAPYQELLDIQTSLLTKYYTPAEIDQLIAFYRTPLGKKQVQVMPELSRGINVMMQTKMQRAFPAVLARLQQIATNGEPSPKTGGTKKSASSAPKK